jgi:competence protein ComEA
MHKFTSKTSKTQQIQERDMNTHDSNNRSSNRSNSTTLRASTLAMAAFLFFGALLGLPGRSAAQQVEEDTEETTEQAQGVVNIQTATAEQLQLLRGIGPSRAQAILESRERRPFRRVEDILRVRGVGRATFRRIRGQLTVEGATTLAADRR